MNKPPAPTIHLDTLSDTELLATRLAPLLIPGDIILLNGDLGAGKTTLAQCLARTLEVPDDQYVSSPTYNLLHEYQGRLPLHHMDLYRLQGPDDVEAAGLFDYFSPDAVCLVEWPDRLGTELPDSYLRLTYTLTAKGRDMTLEGIGTTWPDRIAALIEQYDEIAAE
jgi:tRNA threonylcarbamoyladenosine biosynthesis protein TsaE